MQRGAPVVEVGRQSGRTGGEECVGGRHSPRLDIFCAAKATRLMESGRSTMDCSDGPPSTGPEPGDG